MENPDKIINDPIKATLFGKFYEKIILRWLKETTDFAPLDGKPRIYWKDVEFDREDTEPSRRLKRSLNKYKTERVFCTPGGLLQKGNSYYIWEAKNWPMWTEGKKPLDQLRDLIYSMPLILSTKAVHQTKEYVIGGILFSWWSKPEGEDKLLEEIRQIVSPRSFEILYTDGVLSDCIKKKYPWYIKIITSEKARIDELFEDLMGNPKS